jgi:hypothetical protein
LANIVLRKIYPPKGKVYVQLRKGKIIYPDPSALALNDEIMRELWQDSATLVGLSEEGRTDGNATNF